MVVFMTDIGIKESNMELAQLGMQKARNLQESGIMVKEYNVSNS